MTIRSVQYLIYTLVKYVLMQLIIIPGLDHLIGRSFNCLIQVWSPACNSNWYRQKWINRVWWGSISRVSEVTLENLHVGLCSRAHPMGGFDNIHTSPLRKTMPSLRGIILCPAFQNGHDFLIHVLEGRFETGYHPLVSRIGNRSLWDLWLTTSNFRSHNNIYKSFTFLPRVRAISTIHFFLYWILSHHRITK